MGDKGASARQLCQLRSQIYMLQVAVGQEVEDYLGRAHYHRGSRRKNGWRNGYEPGKVRTADGILKIDLPQLRATEEPYHSRLARMFWGRW